MTSEATRRTQPPRSRSPRIFLLILVLTLAAAVVGLIVSSLPGDGDPQIAYAMVTYPFWAWALSTPLAVAGVILAVVDHRARKSGALVGIVLNAVALALGLLCVYGWIRASVDAGGLWLPF